MGSDANKMNDGTSFQPTEPALCANGCGFFGTAATMNLCSKCYRDVIIKEEQAASAKAQMNKIINPHKVDDDAEASSSKAVPVEVTSSSSTAAALVVEEEEKKKEAVTPAVVPSNRCSCCRKKVGMLGFVCRCGSTFCGAHRYPENHACTFDFKGQGKDALAKANPVIKADKLDRF